MKEFTTEPILILSRHEQYSGKSMKYFDEESKEKFIPFIIETSAGASRSYMAFLVDAYYEEEVKGEMRSVFEISSETCSY